MTDPFDNNSGPTLDGVEYERLGETAPTVSKDRLEFTWQEPEFGDPEPDDPVRLQVLGMVAGGTKVPIMALSIIDPLLRKPYDVRKFERVFANEIKAGPDLALAKAYAEFFMLTQSASKEDAVKLKAIITMLERLDSKRMGKTTQHNVNYEVDVKIRLESTKRMMEMETLLDDLSTTKRIRERAARLANPEAVHSGPAPEGS